MASHELPPADPHEAATLLTYLHASHDDDVASEGSHKETRTLLVACALTTFFFFVELIGGYYAGSLAVMSDAAHLLSDLAGLLISLLAVSLARFPPSELMSFGYARAEVLGAFVSLIFIWSLTAVLVGLAIRRFFEPNQVDGRLMLIVGTVGLIVNILLGLVLGHGHHGHGGHGAHAHAHFGHSHTANSHSHDYGTHANSQHDNCNHDVEQGSAPTAARGWLDWRRWTGAGIDSVNIRAAYLHVLGDALQSVGVVLAAVIITKWPTLTFVDPLCTLIFACVVVMTTKDLAVQTMSVLMEGSPAGTSLRAVFDRLRQLPGVLRVHDLHIWSITVRRPALSVHLYKDYSASDHDILQRAQHVLSTEFGIDHATIQINCDQECCDESSAGAGKEHCLPSSALS